MLEKWVILLSLVITFGCAESEFGSGGNSTKGADASDDQSNQHSSELNEKSGDRRFSDQFTGDKNKLSKITTIIGIDNSRSMDRPRDHVFNELEDLVDTFLTSDDRLYVVGTSIGAQDWNPPTLDGRDHAEFVPLPIDSCNMLNIFEQTVNQVTIAKDSVVHFIAITDDNAGELCKGKSGMENLHTPSTFKKSMQKNKKIPVAMRFHSVIHLDKNFDCFSSADDKQYKSIGSGYKRLSSDEELRGSIVDICGDNYSEKFAAIKREISKSQGSRFVLESEPKNPDSIIVEVDGVNISGESFFYDSGSNAVIVKSSIEISEGDLVEIKY